MCNHSTEMVLLVGGPADGKKQKTFASSETLKISKMNGAMFDLYTRRYFDGTGLATDRTIFGHNKMTDQQVIDHLLGRTEL